MTLLTTPAMAATAAPSPDELFQRLCIATSARIDAVEARARAAGFVAMADPPPAPAGAGRMVTMVLDGPGGRIALVATTALSVITTRLAANAQVHFCGLTVPGNGWDARGYAAKWLGVAPLFDADGRVIYSYAERPEGNAVVDDARDMQPYVAALNAGQLRTLVVAERGPIHGLSWATFDAPDPPADMPSPPRAVPPSPNAVVEVPRAKP